MELSIIIISFNTKELLKRCLNSVIGDEWSVVRKKRPVTSHQSPVTEIIVVDNASTDGSVEMAKREFPQVKLIENRENLGFAKANNQALRQAQGKYCLLLNSDTEVKPGAPEKLVEFARQHSEAGIIGARLLNPDNSVQASSYHFPSIKRALAEFWLGRKGEYEKYIAATSKEPVEVDVVSFAAALLPKKTLEEIGLLNERYFMYFEDLDYCRRVKRAGLKIYYLPEAEVVHHHGASGKGSNITYQYSVESSKIYNGLPKYWLLSFIIWSGQKWQRIFRRT